MGEKRQLSFKDESALRTRASRKMDEIVNKKT